jgi:hypothetical protein
MGTKMIPFFGIREVVVTGGAVALAHPYGRVADRALGHNVPPDQAASCRKYRIGKEAI